MALGDNKITSSDWTGKDISGLADNPALTAAQLKARFDAGAKEVITPKFNSAIDDTITALGEKMDETTYDADADGKVDDAEKLDGKSSSDFVLASDIIDIAHGGTDASTAQSGIGNLSSAVSCVYSADGNNYAKIGTITCNQYDRAAGIIMIQDSTASHSYGLLEYAFNGYGDSVGILVFNWISKYGFEAYVLPYSATVKYIYIKIPEAWETPRISFLGDHVGSVTLINNEARISSLPTTPDATAYAPRMEYSTTITLNAIHTEYDVTVAWATTDMYFNAIRTDDPISGWLYPICAQCLTNGTVRVFINAFPGSEHDAMVINVKISGWK